jgi:hypothetical protein
VVRPRWRALLQWWTSVHWRPGEILPIFAQGLAKFGSFLGPKTISNHENNDQFGNAERTHLLLQSRKRIIVESRSQVKLDKGQQGQSCPVEGERRACESIAIGGGLQDSWTVRHPKRGSQCHMPGPIRRFSQNQHPVWPTNLKSPYIIFPECL